MTPADKVWFITGLVGGSVLFSVVINMLSKATLYLLKKGLVRSKRSFIVWTHSMRHVQPTPDHNKPLFVCKDPPCDIL